MPQTTPQSMGQPITQAGCSTPDRAASTRSRDGGRSRLFVLAIVAAVGVGGFLGVAFIGSVVADPNRINILDADPGDCFTLPIDPKITELGRIDRQDCAEPHDAEVVAVGELNPSDDRDYPEAELLFDIVDVACGDPRRYLDDGFGLLPVAPNERSWNGQRGRFVCVAVSLGGDLVTGRQIDVISDPGTEDGSADSDGEESASG